MTKIGQLAIKPLPIIQAVNFLLPAKKQIMIQLWQATKIRGKFEFEVKTTKTHIVLSVTHSW